MKNRAEIQRQNNSTLNNILNNIFNNIFNKVFYNISMTLDNLAIVEILSLSFFSRENRATNVALCWLYKNMDMPHAHEGREK